MSLWPLAKAGRLTHSSVGMVVPLAPGKQERARVAARLAVGITLLGFLLLHDPVPPDLVLGPGLVLGIVGAAMFYLAGQFVSAVRWRGILGRDARPILYLFRLFLIGAFGSLFLPTSIGGDGIRVIAISRETGRAGRALSSVLTDRAMGVGAMLGYLGLGIILAPEVLGEAGAQFEIPLTVLVGIPVVALGLVGLVAALRRRRHNAFLQHLRGGVSAMTTFARSPRRVATALLLSLVVQALYIGAWMVLSRGVGFELPLTTMLVGVPIVSLGAMAPITFSGLGVREGLWVVLLAPYGLGTANVIAFSLMYFAALTLVGTVGGLLFIWRGTAFHHKPSPAPLGR